MTDLATPDLGTDYIPTMLGLPDNDEWDRLLSMADTLAKSKLIPKPLQGHAEDVLIILLHARELRLPTMLAMDKIHVIESKPSMSAELMGSLIQRSGHHWKPHGEITPESATVEFARKEWPEGQVERFTFTIEDARTAGLLDIWWRRWVSDGNRNRPEDWYLPTIPRDPGDVTAAMLEEFDAPEWVVKLGPGGMSYKDPWWHYPKSMLWARAASQAARIQFADVLMGVSLTPEELGAEIDPMTGEVVNGPADDAVKQALLARATSLPAHQQAQMRSWFKEVQAPAIKNLPEKWVRAVDDKLADLEQTIILGATTNEPPADDPTRAMIDAHGVIDTTATEQEPAGSAGLAAPEAPVAPPEAEPTEPRDRPAGPAESHKADPIEEVAAAVAKAQADRAATKSDDEAPDLAEPAPNLARDIAPDSSTSARQVAHPEPELAPEPELEPEPVDALAPTPWVGLDRDQLIALGKNRLVDAVNWAGGTIKAKATLSELADAYLAAAPFGGPGEVARDSARPRENDAASRDTEPATDSEPEQGTLT